ncbi:hypothetical protein CU102_00830 [Phyllobacterium brassicacearum]|uniref:Uncharacterized protein n=1 Tax=Phyllobacterium brassicacearum TaxID=314235 RepID=A0A2P7BW09_9HYPH|nr:hypothetical protein CU102_00830 [Phyllobacterium brassicacearum]
MHVSWVCSLPGCRAIGWRFIQQIQIVDPVRKDIAVDISPMMRKHLGTVFAQHGVLLASGAGNISVPCPDPSPASSSNLVYFKGDEQRSFSVVGIYG